MTVRSMMPQRHAAGTIARIARLALQTAFVVLAAMPLRAADAPAVPPAKADAAGTAVDARAANTSGEGAAAQAPDRELFAVDTSSPDALRLSTARRYFPIEAADLPAKRIFRLTRAQLDASVAALLPGIADNRAMTVMPKDPLQTNYEYAEMLSFNAANLGPLGDWIAGIVANVRKRPRAVIDCAAGDAGCITSKGRRFVLRAFRGDIGDAQIDRIIGFQAAGVAKAGLAQATGDLVEVVLKSPDFLFRKELDVDWRGRLSPSQLLQALTYIIADSPPDALGFEPEAPRRHLATREVAQQTIATIVASPQAREKLLRFFKAWLELKEPGTFTISQETFPDFTGKLADAMLAETDRFLKAQLGTARPKLADITQATVSYVPDDVAKLYQLDAKASGAQTPVALDPTQRLGIFTQPAVIASHSGPTSSRPVKRGVFWVRKVMCMEMQPPPPGIDTTLYENTSSTERERIETLTAKKACIGCHRVIDPFGFAQENYDALGRWRTKENGFAIDPAVEIDFLDEGETKTETAVGALKTLTNSMMFKQCFVRQLFRFYMGRNEEPGDDPLLRRAFLTLAATDDLLAVISLMASSERLARRG